MSAPEGATDLTGLLTERPDAMVEAHAEESGLVEAVNTTTPRHPPSPTALVTDTWTRDQGAKLADEWKALDVSASFAMMTRDEAMVAAIQQHNGANVGLGPGAGRKKFAGTTGGVAVPVAPPKGAKTVASLADVAKLDEGAFVAADAFGALFEAAPHLAEDPADKGRSQYWGEVLAGDEYQALHRRTAHQVELARIGAGALALQYASYANAKGNKDAPNPNSPEGIADEARRMRSVRRAIKGATDEVEAAEAAAQGLGGADEIETLAPAELAKVARLAASDRTLRAILQAAGRYRTRARSLQTERLDAHRGFITGVQLSGDLSIALPLERAAVGGAVPELELLAQYRLATKRLLAYRHKARTPVQAGPIVISVDESSSMEGEPMICAKGIALAMAWVARSQRRPCVLSAFAGTPAIRAIAAERGYGYDRTPPEQIAAWCTTQMGGGTVPDGPLETLRSTDYLNLAATKGKTDHIIITDAELSVDDGMVHAYKTWAERYHVRTFVIVIGDDPGDMAKVATRCWCVNDLSLSQSAVEAALSISPE